MEILPHALAVWVIVALQVGAQHPQVLRLQRDDAAGQLGVEADGKRLFCYQYGVQEPLPHYWPIFSPTGKVLTVQQTEPYPHHRSFWIADHVRAADSEAVDFYHWTKNTTTQDSTISDLRHRIRHLSFARVEVENQRAYIEADLQWLVDGEQPIMDERRSLRVVALGAGEYLLDLTWELRAAHGPLQFVSDQVHYAWPFVRMHPSFSGQQGGTIVNDSGQRGQAATDGKAALWIDYSNDVDGLTEGLALMWYPDGQTHSWLTREYGTFGPRRSAAKHGTKFTLAAEEVLQGRVGLLIHRGDAALGRVAERYQQYIKDQL